VHDTFVIVVQAIRKGELREPERLMGFVRTVVRRQVAAQIDHAVQSAESRPSWKAKTRFPTIAIRPRRQRYSVSTRRLLDLCCEAISGRTGKS